MYFIDVVEWVTVMNYALNFPISTIINRISGSHILDKRNVTDLNRERTENSLNTITLKAHYFTVALLRIHFEGVFKYDLCLLRIIYYINMLLC